MSSRTLIELNQLHQIVKDNEVREVTTSVPRFRLQSGLVARAKGQIINAELSMQRSSRRINIKRSNRII